MRRQGIVVLICVALLAMACGDDSPTSPSNSGVTGTWVGSIQSTITGASTVRVTLTQSGSMISGSYSIAQGQAVDAGNVSGMINGAGINLTATPSDPRTCPFQVTAVWSGNIITGTYAAFNCTVAFSGSISLTRQ